MNDDAALRLLLDERDIERVLHNYCRAIDRGDLDLLRTVFHPDARAFYGYFEGTAPEFVGHVAKSLGPGGYTALSHCISNIRIDLDGDVARVETYLNACHTLVHPDGDMVHETLGARYLDRFERREQGWRIAVRRLVFDWSRTAPVTERSYFTRRKPAAEYRGVRSADDPSYRRD